jgi:hypothetical protein
MLSGDRGYIMTAMMRRTAKTLASSMQRLEKTAELLDASRAFLNVRGSFIGGMPFREQDWNRPEEELAKRMRLSPESESSLDRPSNEPDR